MHLLWEQGVVGTIPSGRTQCKPEPVCNGLFLLIVL
jgi:hypothetical protein